MNANSTTRLSRATELIEEGRDNLLTPYGEACIHIAMLELVAAVGKSDRMPTPPEHILKAFNTKTHTICRVVSGQCVLCGKTE